MNKYELAIVLSAALDDEAKNASLEKIKGDIERFGGTISNVNDWGKKKLAYEIKKMSEAYYTFIKFEADPACPAKVEENLRLMEQVLRFLCVKEEA